MKTLSQALNDSLNESTKVFNSYKQFIKKNYTIKNVNEYINSDGKHMEFTLNNKDYDLLFDGDDILMVYIENGFDDVIENTNDIKDFLR